MGACDEAVAWSRAYGNPEAAYRACERGDWLGWLIDRLGLSSEAITPAWRVCYEATAAARRAYQEAIRAAVPWERVAAKLEER
jgi:hypothetical protein